MNKSYNIAKGGLLTALSLIFLYLGSIMPTNKLAFLTLASCIIPLSLLMLGVKSAVIIYAASSILSLLLGLKGSALVYTLFFGSYGFIKYYCEALRKPILEIFLKLAFFNVTVFISYIVYKLLFIEIPTFKISFYLLAVGLQIAFIFYDYALTLIIAYINKRLPNILK